MTGDTGTDKADGKGCIKNYLIFSESGDRIKGVFVRLVLALGVGYGR